MATVAERLRKALPARIDYQAATASVVVDSPVIVTSDVHLPYTNERLFDQLYTAVKRHGASDVWVIGDLFNLDAYSRFAEGLNSQVAGFKDELRAAQAFLDILFEVATRVRITQGNHDVRILKQNKMRFGAAEFFRMVYPKGGNYPGGVGTFTGPDGRTRQLIVSDLPTIQAEVFGEKWVFTHPANYSLVPGKVARSLAAKWHANVGIGHTHCWQMSKDFSGKFWTLDLGGLFDVRYFDYVHEAPTTNPEWSNGFFVLDEGRVCPYPG